MTAERTKGAVSASAGKQSSRTATVIKGASAALASAAVVAASVAFAPQAAPQARVNGIHADLQRAVQLKQLTPEQAARFEERMSRTILGSGGGSGGDESQA
ncbi:hypothetical protein [Arthrobacter sp. Y-9]|uniref:hypothetical protein n=1 Tax=Arthrobacter sp. Y-9 TaxID=3039385 RepID=UPI00241EC1D4|nr:hypothetical protein [Arthrobacter sp. Y-9]WFR83495.1 hypothetical protein P9849_13165 [Arthrobacter sp. Y-9]